jgi:hypothetical protein
MSFFSSLGKALKSKTVWAGIGTAALGAGELAQQYAPTILQFVPPATPVGAGITIALGALTIYGRIRAHQPLGPVIGDTVDKTIEAVSVMRNGAVTTRNEAQGVKNMVKAAPAGPTLGPDTPR